jgi:hypothetical protein
MLLMPIMRLEESLPSIVNHANRLRYYTYNYILRAVRNTVQHFGQIINYTYERNIICNILYLLLLFKQRTMIPS